jgi:hypothetical protein
MPGLLSVSCISLGAPPKSATLLGSQSKSAEYGWELLVHPARTRGATVGGEPANAAAAGAAMVAIATPNAHRVRRDVNLMSAIFTLPVDFCSLSAKARRSLTDVLTVRLNPL